MSQSVLFPENYSVFVVDFISTCNDTSCRLPGNRWSHVFSAFFSNWLHMSFGISVAFRRTDEGIHHLVSGDTFSAILGLDVEYKEISIGPPWESGVIWKGLLILIQGDFIDKIELRVELKECAVLGDNIQILLSGWERRHSNPILILRLDINHRISIHRKDTPSLSHTKHFILLNKVLSKKDFGRLKLD